MTARLDGADRDAALRRRRAATPNVWLFVGVNGVGKTTTIGKVGAQQAAEGRTVLMAAGDTFRAAAAEQLDTWAERAGADLVRGNEGGDPSAVIFDAVERAAARGIDLVLADTAGRLHTKTNLMEELRKVRRVADKGAGQVTEVLLVIDATTGQNGLDPGQASSATPTDVTGVVLTKLDGSAKGGIVFAIETELGIPVKLVGLGETIERPRRRSTRDEFVDALVRASLADHTEADRSIPWTTESPVGALGAGSVSGACSTRSPPGSKAIVKRLRGKGRLTDDDVDEVLQGDPHRAARGRRQRRRRPQRRRPHPRAGRSAPSSARRSTRASRSSRSSTASSPRCSAARR